MKLIFFALTKGNNSFDDIDHYITRQRQVVNKLYTIVITITGQRDRTQLCIAYFDKERTTTPVDKIGYGPISKLNDLKSGHHWCDLRMNGRVDRGNI